MQYLCNTSPSKFDEILNSQSQSKLSNPNPGTNTATTRGIAETTDIIRGSNARLGPARREVKKALGGMDVDLSIVRAGGDFDSGARIPILKQVD